MPKNIPIGVDNFSKLVDPAKDYLFVDKTEMIARVIEDGSEVSNSGRMTMNSCIKVIGFDF